MIQIFFQALPGQRKINWRDQVGTYCALHI